ASEKAAVKKGGCTEKQLVDSLELVVGDLLGAAPVEAALAPGSEPRTSGGPTFALMIDARPQEADVLIDGRALGRGSVTARLDPGAPHKLTVRREGFGEYEEQVSLSE